MNGAEFGLLEPARLVEHEEVEDGAVRVLIERLRADAVVRDPIWVARGSWVVLNGHHRFRALVTMGAHRIPAWIFDYDDPRILLERWSPGPPLTKAGVVARARSGVPYPPKTTKHVLKMELPDRPTPLAELLAPVPPPAASAPPARRAQR